MNEIILLTATGLGLAGLYFLVASGLSLIYGLMGVLNFAHGAFLTLGAYGAYFVVQRLLERNWGLTSSLTLGLLASLIAGGLIAWFTEAALIRRLYARHIDQVLVTVGLGLAIGAAIAGYAGQDSLFLLTPPWLDNVLVIGEARIPYDRFILIGSGLLLFVILQLILQKTRLGLIIRAGVENRSMVTALGIDVRTAFTAVFVIGGIAAGLAGALTGVYYRQVNPAMGAGLLIFAFIVVVIGGMGSLAGTAVASVIVGLIQQFTNYYATGIGDLAVVLLLALVLLTRPQGLLGKAAV